MQRQKWSRREVLGASTGMVVRKAAPPPPVAVTPELIEAARKEGKISYYAAIELNVAERLGKMFEAKSTPALKCGSSVPGPSGFSSASRRSRGSGIHAVDVANSTDTAHYLDWKRTIRLATYLPEEVAQHFPPDQFDPQGLYATSCAWLETIGYNTNLVKAEEAPKSYADLLDPKWQGKIVKGHPSYSGAILRPLSCSCANWAGRIWKNWRSKG